MGEKKDEWQRIRDVNAYEGMMKDTMNAVGPECGTLLGSRTTGYVQPVGEIRATDPNSGGQKGVKLARFSLIPWDALWKVAEHFGVGAKKYEERNWERGYPWSWSYDGLCRHLAADLQGEERDPETGSLHIVAVAWHALVLVAYRLRRIGRDDRSEMTRMVVNQAVTSESNQGQGRQ